MTFVITSADVRSVPCLSRRHSPKLLRPFAPSAILTAGSRSLAVSFRVSAASAQGSANSQVSLRRSRGAFDSRGLVLDTASRRLSALRREIGRLKERIQDTLRQMLRSPEIKRILRFPNYSTVGHHYVLPVAKDKRGEIQGAVLRTSSSNETVYIEPAAVGEQSAQLSFLRTGSEGGSPDPPLAECAGRPGFTAAPGHARDHGRSRLDLRPRTTEPRLQDVGPALQPRGTPGPSRRPAPLTRGFVPGRPCLRKPAPPEPVPAAAPGPSSEEAPSDDRSAHAVAGSPEHSPRTPPPATTRTVVPIDLSLGVRFRILVVTGPNTGGKTVALKTVGLLALMAQSGLHVPTAEGSQFPIFDDVLADIGDEQSLEQSLSTFSSHVRRISEILGKATGASLVLLDELGAGTDPTDGAALGRAILDELARLGCRAIVTTHIGDLKTYAFSNPDAENAAVEFDDETLEPKYRLHVGDIGQSKALEIARQLKLPAAVVERAESYLADRLSHGVPTGKSSRSCGRKRRSPARPPSTPRPRPNELAKRSTSDSPSCRKNPSARSTCPTAPCAHSGRRPGRRAATWV